VRILCVSSWFPCPPDNGARLRAYHLLRGLARRHDVSLLTFARPGEATDARCAELSAFCLDVEVVEGDPYRADVRLGRLALLDPWPRSFRATYSSRMADRIAVAVETCDVAVAFQVGAALYFRDVTSRPRVFEEAELTVYREGSRRSEHLRPRLRQLLTWAKFSRFIASLEAALDHTTVVSEREAALLRQVVGRDGEPARISVVPNAVDSRLLAVEPGRRASSRLIFPGALTYGANLEGVAWFLERAWPAVRAARPDATLWVTGDVPEAVGEELAGIPGLVLTGRLDDVYPAVAESAACIVPLLTGGGTRLKVLEAMALRTPIVATPKAVEGLDLVHGRHYFEADSAPAFVEAVLAVLARPAEASERAARARTLVADRYTWDRSGDLLELALEQAVESFARRRSP
jgi:polysaccharide biosynthesis protein PslH